MFYTCILANAKTIEYFNDIKQKKEELQKKETSIKKCVTQLNNFMTYDVKGKEFYYSVELLKREKELEKLKREFDERARDYRRMKEKGEVEVG